MKGQTDGRTNIQTQWRTSLSEYYGSNKKRGLNTKKVSRKNNNIVAIHLFVLFLLISIVSQILMMIFKKPKKILNWNRNKILKCKLFSFLFTYLWLIKYIYTTKGIIFINIICTKRYMQHLCTTATATTITN